MKTMSSGPWIIEVNLEKNKEWYDENPTISCTCDYCANYKLACDTFPSSVKNFFNTLGIDPQKEGEVSHYVENEDGTHLYSVFYHFYGAIIKGPKKEGTYHKLPHSSFGKNESIDIGLHTDLELVPSSMTEPVIQLEIAEILIPWLLKKEEDVNS
ncbi:hypothetical protein [Alkalihalobacillus trypoxylicola]|uniref:Uncharacterized protein n=1 Tax=Alkalihalobacillus trypoxylicola TaxID=519424 RepID=A0A162CQ92_9BACI|nr:hypothetical protein [Alkalihalobacillus trypoxylicola]KYG25992.1 hypothetical protein AZF04_12960 [Alkalihalobacillus trypoxylicola]